MGFTTHYNWNYGTIGQKPWWDEWITLWQAVDTALDALDTEVTALVANLPHSSLNNLSYASAAHVGFEPTVTKGNLTAGSAKVTIGGTGTGALIGAGVSVDINQTNIDHGSIGGLSDDDHSQYTLLDGRAGGQAIYGGTEAGENLRFYSTYHSTKGKIYLGANSYFDELADSLYIKKGLGVGTLENEQGRIVVKRNIDTAWPSLILQNLSTGASAQLQLILDKVDTGGITKRWNITVDAPGAPYSSAFNIEAIGASGVEASPLSLQRTGEVRIGGPLQMRNDYAIQARNYADSAYLNMAYIDTSNSLVLGYSLPVAIGYDLPTGKVISLGFNAVDSDPIVIHVGGVNQKIEVGAINSGGTDYRMLRVLN